MAAFPILVLFLLCWVWGAASLVTPNPVQRLMLGRYDNKQQADADLARGKPTAALGGHEYVTAIITPHPVLPTVLLAQYYFGADPAKTFRLRCYEFVQPCSADPASSSAPSSSASGPASTSFRMRLYRPLPATEAALRAASYDLQSPSVQRLPSFSPALLASTLTTADASAAGAAGAGASGAGAAEAASASLPPPLAALLPDFEHLTGCDVCWAPLPPAAPAAPAAPPASRVVGWRAAFSRLLPFLATVTPPIPSPSPSTSITSASPSFRGSLYEGSCSLCSQADPNVVLTVRDDLGLHADRLEINDRVYNAEGRMVIGNSEGVPYCLRRL